MSNLGFNIDIDTSSTDKAVKSVDRLIKSLEKSAKVLGVNKEVSEKIIPKFATLRQKLEQAADSTGKLAAAQKGQVTRLRNQEQAINKQISGYASVNNQITKQQNILTSLNIGYDRSTATLIANAKAAGATSDQLKELSSVLLQQKRIEQERVQGLKIAKAEQKALAEAERQRVAALKATEAANQARINQEAKISANLSKQNTILNYLNKGMSKHQATVLANAKAAGYTDRQLQQLNNTLTRQQAIVDKASKKFKGMSTVLRQLAPAVGALGVFALAAQGIRSFIETADVLTNLNNRITLLSDGTATLSTEFDNLYRIANESRTSISDVGVLFSRLVPIMGSLGGTTKEAAGITEAFSKLLLISGTSTREASSAILQFSQAMGKGKLDGDEFRTVAEATPEVLRILEQQLGKTREELFKMSREGKLTADILGNALISSLDGLDKKLKSVPLTFGQSMQLLRTELTASVKKIEDNFNVTGNLAKVVQDLTSGVKTATDAFINFYNNNQEVISSLMKMIYQLTLGYTAYKVFTGASLLLSSKVLPALALGVRKVSFAFNVLSAATAGSVKAMTLLKSALVTTGIGALIVAVGYLADKFLFANDAMSEFFDSATEGQKLAEINNKIAEAQERVNKAISSGNLRVRAGAEKELNNLLEERFRIQKSINNQEKEELKLKQLKKPLNPSEIVEEIGKLDEAYKKYGKSKQELLLIEAQEQEARLLTTRIELEALKVMKERSKEDELRYSNLADMVTVLEEYTSKLKRNAAQISGGEYTKFLEDIQKTNKELKLTFSGLGSAAVNQAKFNDSIKKFSPAQQKALKSLYAENEALERQISIRDKLLEQKAKEFEKSEDVFASQRELPQVFKDITEAEKTATQASKDALKTAKEQLETLGFTNKQLREYELAKLRKKAADENDAIAMAGASKELEKQIKNLEEMNKVLDELEKSKALEEFSQNFADAFYDGIDSGIDYLKDQLKRQAFKVLLEPTLKQIGGQLGGILGLGGTGGSTGSLGASALLNNQGGALGSLASGGLNGLALNSLLNNGTAINTFAFEAAKGLGLASEAAGAFANITTKFASNIAPYAGSITQLLSGNVKGAAGSAIGTYVGSFAGPIGAAIGGALGGMFGGSSKISASNLGGAFTGSQATNMSDRYKAILAGLGGTGNAEFFFSGNTGRQGQNPNFNVSTWMNGRRLFSGFDTRVGATGENGTFLPGEIALNDENLALYTTRAIVGALQASDFADNIDALFDKVDIRVAGIEELNATLANAELLKNLNTLFGQMTLGIRDLSGASFETVQSFLNAVGGLDGLQNRLNVFYNEFTSEERKFEDTTRVITEAIRSVGGSLFSTRDQFKNFFETLGSESFAKVSPLLEQIDFYYDTIEQKEREAYEASLKSIEDLRKAGLSIADYIRNLNMTEETLSPAQKLQNTQAEFNRLLSLSQTGDQDALGKITSVSDKLLNAARSFYGSASPFQNIFNSVQDQLKQLVFLTTGEKFATGAAFDSGVVSRPTRFNSSLMGEAGPEAIMPLTNVGGSLGIQARMPDMSGIISELRALRQDIKDSDNTNITIVTEDGKTIVKKTLKQLKDESRNGKTMIYAAGVSK